MTKLRSGEELQSHAAALNMRKELIKECIPGEQALRDNGELIELLNACSGAPDLPALLRQALGVATRISGARFGALHAPPLQAWSAPEAAMFEPCVPPQIEHGVAALRIDDAWADPRARAAPLRSYLATPLTSRDGAPLGTLFLGHPEPAMFDARSARMAAGIAALAALAIDNMALCEAGRQAAAERRELQGSEHLARAEAERSRQMKDEFLSTLSHELRTPLSAILGWAQVLRRGMRDQADLQRGLESIERNARAQAQLIEDLLDMGRITSGKVLLDRQSIFPAAIIQAAVETLRPAAEAKNIALELDVDAPGAVVGDSGRLQQIIWNLLSNALKFTPRDGTVRLLARAAGGNIEIAVSDSGIGIAPEFLPHVFERFRQADASTTRKHGGLGLGLAIVKQLVEQHGGSVSVSSAGVGLGACFTVQLPLAGAPSSAALPDLSRLKILVVDDEPDARELIERILSDCKAQVFLAADAAQALQLLLNERPDVLVSDIGMPDIDGFDLLGLVRAMGAERGGNLPAIALSAFARPEERQRALDCGFVAHLPKPVEALQLIATVLAVTA
ncbi:signal transduction histidine kinase [Oxalobacteraceae bacterium GrIS 1.11]